ncbi:MAG TPA: tetratricopeptide repeat protein [Vicinamibacterales bacterium]|jgi:tetratricopeptide (TPR) repeat protein|nr:tetratricopeptide repeat protein [Vicinamibacterales bacterium]
MKGVVGLLAICASLSACAPKPVAVIPAAPSGPTPAQRLADADNDLQAGCLDCLTSALKKYEDLRSEPATARAALSGTVRAAGLLALRELGLGMSDSGYLARAKALIAGDDELEARYGVALETLGAKAPRVGRIAPANDSSVDRARLVLQNRLRWTEWLRAEADGDDFLAAAWVSFACTTAPPSDEARQTLLLAPLVKHRNAPVVRYELASCASPDVDRLQELVMDEARFREVDYWLGFSQLRDGNLDRAQQTMQRVYDWHPAWPAAASSLGGVMMSGEDFSGALTLYEQALKLFPGLVDALLGRVRALSYLGRADEAIAAANEFLPTLPSDAYYWRAWNKNQLNDIEGAWADVVQAEAIRVTNETAKLAGVIAYRRTQLATARDRFQAATRINPNDCESHFYLGGVEAELKAWTPSADAYLLASSCMEAERGGLERQIAALEASDGDPVRVARQLANRHASLDVNLRRTRQAWFNLAAAYYNLQRYSEARPFAEKLVDDEQYGERARSLLGYLTRERL